MGASTATTGDDATVATARALTCARRPFAGAEQPRDRTLTFSDRPFADDEHCVPTDRTAPCEETRLLANVPWGEKKDVIFLSYAKEDREIATKIARWFVGQGIDVYNWLAP